MHVYELHKPYPGNALLEKDVNGPLEGVIEYMVELDNSEDDEPNTVELHVRPTGKNGVAVPEEDWIVVTLLCSDMLELVDQVPRRWVEERQEELEDEDEPQVWRCTGRFPLPHVYEMKKPYPGNALLADGINKPLLGVVEFAAQVDADEDTDAPNAIELHVCPSGPNGWPDKTQPRVVGGKTVFAESWHRVRLQRSLMSEILRHAPPGWMEARQAELEDMPTAPPEAG